MNLFLFVWGKDKNLTKIAMSLSAVEGGEGGERGREREITLCFFIVRTTRFFYNLGTKNNGNVRRFTLEDIGVVVAGRSVV